MSRFVTTISLKNQMDALIHMENFTTPCAVYQARFFLSFPDSVSLQFSLHRTPVCGVYVCVFFSFSVISFYIHIFIEV